MIIIMSSFLLLLLFILVLLYHQLSSCHGVVVHDYPPSPPPKRPPAHLWQEYTMNDTIPMQGWYFDSRSFPNNNNVPSRRYEDKQLSKLFQEAQQQIPQADVYPETDVWMFEAFRRYPIQGQRVLIVGSQVPWYEMLSLAYGARMVVCVGKFSQKNPLLTPNVL